MRRFFARNILFVISVNLLVKPAWIFLIDRTVQNKVGHAPYGIYLALFNLGLVFQILLDFGINNYNSTQLAQNPKQLNQLFPAMMTARVALSGLYLLIVTGIALLLGYRGWEIGLLSGVLLIQCINSILQFIRSNANGLHKFKADGILSVSDRLLMILLCGFLLVYPGTKDDFRIEWFVIAQIASYGVAVIIGILMLKRLTRVRLRFSLDVPKVWSIIKLSFPYALLIFLMSIYTRADMMLVERLCGDAGKEQAGIYAQAYRLLDVGNMFGIMFAGMLLPLFGRMLANGTNVLPIVRLSLNLLMPVSFLVMVVGIFFNAEIMNWLYKDTDPRGIQAFTWLMMAFPAFSLSNVFSTLLTSKGDLPLLNRIAFAGVVLNLALNFLLIPKYLSLGAAISAFVTQTLLAIMFMIFAQQRADLPRSAKRTFSFLGFLVILLAAGYGVQLLPLSWFLQLGILAATGFAMIFAFRFISVRAVMQLMGGQE